MITHNIQIRNLTIEITIFDPEDGFAQVRYVENSNIEHIFKIKPRLPKQVGTDVIVEYSCEVGVVGLERPRESFSSTYRDSEALILLEQFPMALGGSNSPRQWMIKHMINGLISRLPEFYGTEENFRGTGYEPFLLNGDPVQPVVLDGPTVKYNEQDNNYTITVNVVNTAVGTTTYILKNALDNAEIQYVTSGVFNEVPVGSYIVEVIGADTSKREQRVNIAQS